MAWHGLYGHWVRNQMRIKSPKEEKRGLKGLKTAQTHKIRQDIYE